MAWCFARCVSLTHLQVWEFGGPGWNCMSAVVRPSATRGDELFRFDARSLGPGTSIPTSLISNSRYPFFFSLIPFFSILIYHFNALKLSSLTSPRDSLAPRRSRYTNLPLCNRAVGAVRKRRAAYTYPPYPGSMPLIDWWDNSRIRNCCYLPK